MVNLPPKVKAGDVIQPEWGNAVVDSLEWLVEKHPAPNWRRLQYIELTEDANVVETQNFSWGEGKMYLVVGEIVFYQAPYPDNKFIFSVISNTGESAYFDSTFPVEGEANYYVICNFGCRQTTGLFNLIINNLTDIFADGNVEEHPFSELPESIKFKFETLGNSKIKAGSKFWISEYVG